MCQPLVSPQVLASGTDNGTGPQERLVEARAGMHQGAVVAAGNETNVLALGLLGGGKVSLARQGAGVALDEITQRKERAGKQCPRNAPQEVRLVLGRVEPTPQLPVSVFTAEDAGVVAGGKPGGAGSASPLP